MPPILVFTSVLKKKWKTKQLLLFTILLCLSISAKAQEDKFRLMFYNVENLFDTQNDSLKNDEEFLPRGDRYWNNTKLNKKLNRITQVVLAAGQGDLPVMVGMCEVESHRVLEQLLYQTPLNQLGYRLIHRESPDNRGIDVALIYLQDIFLPISYKTIGIHDPRFPGLHTRDVLYVKGVLAGDTLHVLVNHWPSKYGGLLETKPLRALTAGIVRTALDSILHMNRESKIVLMGDFNDTPFDESIKHHLAAQSSFRQIDPGSIYNLAFPLANAGKGSYKYQGNWSMIDQMMVSGELLQSKTGLYTHSDYFCIFSPAFLLEKDKNYLGDKPFRTYIGFKYNDGFSDHLPVLLDLYSRTP